MKNILLALSLLLIATEVYSHNEFYIVNQNLLAETKYPSPTWNKNELLKWSSAQRGVIPINIMSAINYLSPAEYEKSIDQS